MLNACYTAEQARGIAEQIEAVVSISRQIESASSIEFAAAFYRALGYGRDVKTAVDLGRNQIGLRGLSDSKQIRLSGAGDVAAVRFGE